MIFNVDDLVDQKLVTKKAYTDGVYKGLSVLKYSRKVFYDNLWNVDERLLECRGRIVDEDNNVIVNPFKKVFNLHENGTEVEPNTFILAPRKVNGFLGCVTNTEKYGVIYSTTGSLNSEYVDLIKKHVPLESALELPKGFTIMFEICDTSDPHIIQENEGAYLIGARHIEANTLIPESFLDVMAEHFNLKRPEVWSGLFGDLPHTNMEGYMILKGDDGVVLAKLKSPTYLSKKALQRCGKNKALRMWNDPEGFKQQLDEEFYDVFDKILDTFTMEEYLSMQEQDRRKWIEDYFNE